APSFPIRSTRARNSRPAPSKTATSSPVPRRSTCDRCRASSSVSRAVAAAASIDSARKRGSTGRIIDGEDTAPAPLAPLAPLAPFRLYSTPLLFKGQQLGKYKISAPLGSGGGGRGYFAYQSLSVKKGGA